MINRKSLTWFLIITFGLAWPLFLLPLAFGPLGSAAWQGVAAITWALAMWAPGVAAILVTRFINRQPVRSLNLGRLGEKRAYLWAWLAPIGLALLAGLFTWLLRAGQLDLTFSAIRASLEQAGELPMPAGLLVAVQILVALTIAPLFNTLFALGEELGWRGFLLPQLLSLGQGRAILLSGVIWGFWHAPAILQGHNYPNQPVAGVFLMVVFTVLLSVFFSWLYLRTRSPWAPALAHGSVNAVAALPLLFLTGVDITIGGTLVSLIGWIPLAFFAAWLFWSGRLPVKEAGEQEKEASAAARDAQVFEQIEE